METEMGQPGREEKKKRQRKRGEKKGVRKKEEKRERKGQRKDRGKAEERKAQASDKIIEENRLRNPYDFVYLYQIFSDRHSDVRRAGNAAKRKEKYDFYRRDQLGCKAA